MFWNNDKIKELQMEHLSEIRELENKIEKLDGLLLVKDMELVFFKDRGERYMTQLKMRDEESSKLLELAKELLKNAVEAKVSQTKLSP